MKILFTTKESENFIKKELVLDSLITSISDDMRTRIYPTTSTNANITKLYDIMDSVTKKQNKITWVINNLENFTVSELKQMLPYCTSLPEELAVLYRLIECGCSSLVREYTERKFSLMNFKPADFDGDPKTLHMFYFIKICTNIDEYSIDNEAGLNKRFEEFCELTDPESMEVVLRILLDVWQVRTADKDFSTNLPEIDKQIKRFANVIGDNEFFFKVNSSYLYSVLLDKDEARFREIFNYVNNNLEEAIDGATIINTSEAIEVLMLLNSGLKYFNMREELMNNHSAWSKEDFSLLISDDFLNDYQPCSLFGDVIEDLGYITNALEELHSI